MHSMLTDDIIKCHILLLCNWVLKVTGKVVQGKQYKVRRNCIMLVFEVVKKIIYHKLDPFS